MIQDPPSDLVGRRYLLQDALGEGAMGVVYRALDRLTGKPVALKQVRIPVDKLEFGSKEERADLQLTLAQEFKILATLRHPSIISVLDYGFSQHGEPYVAMELLDAAQTISEAGEGKSVEEKLVLLRQLLQALTYLHRRGILHRDLKPNNVLVVRAAADDDTGGGDSDGGGAMTAQVKVLDFGVSVAHGEGTKAEVTGTPSYMAPELWTGKPASKSSDLYAFGVIAYEVFAGRKPFEGEKFADLYRKVRGEAPDLTAIDAPDEIRAVIGRLLAKTPEQRFSDASELISLLRRSTVEYVPTESADVRESFLQAASFVGREAELALLTDQLKNAIDGRGSAWLIGGESGVGKSRLLEELRTLAMVEGAVVLRGQVNREGDAPYTVWRDVIRWLSLATELDQNEASVLKALVPDIGKLRGRDVPDAPEIPAQADQARLIGVIDQVFRRQQSPLVVILEDLHWAGDESLALLRQVNQMVAGAPLLIIASYRDDERPGLSDLLPQMKIMKLHRLSEEGTADLVEAMLGPQGRQPELLRLLQKETEGNVFFLVEMVRALAEEAGEMGRIGEGPLPTHVLTGGVQGIVRRRLNRVPESAREVLEIAAVGGRQLDLDVIAEVTRGMGRSGSVELPVNQLGDAAVISVQDGYWQFTHSKLRDGVLVDLPVEKARDLHSRVATAIESVYQYSTRPIAAALAYHWGEAGDLAKEEQYNALAGEQALRTGGYQAARAFLSRAFELQEPLEKPQRKRATLLTQLGDVYAGMGDDAEARRYYEQSLELCRSIKYGWGIANNLNNLSALAFKAEDYERVVECTLEALKVATEVRAVPGALTALLSMAALENLFGEPSDAVEYVGLVLHHPAADGQTHYLGERLLAQLRDELEPDVLQASLERGKELSLREVTNRILSRL